MLLFVIPESLVLTKVSHDRPFFQIFTSLPIFRESVVTFTAITTPSNEKKRILHPLEAIDDAFFRNAISPLIDIYTMSQLSDPAYGGLGLCVRNRFGN